LHKYFYRAIDLNKKTFKGYFLAKDEEDLRVKLSSQNLFLIRARAIPEKSPRSFFSAAGKVSSKELIGFCRQFAIMTDSGVTIPDALTALKKQPYSKPLKKALQEVCDDIKAGKALSEAMALRKNVFPDFCTSMTRVGEQSGLLSDVFYSLADYYEKESSIKQRTGTILAYPILLAFLTAAVFILIMAVVIPTFESALKEINVELPAITAAIINVDHWFKENWKYLLIILCAVAVVIILIGKTEAGRYFYDSLKIYIPPSAQLKTALICSAFARGFGLLLHSGTELVNAMEIIAPVLGNKNVEKRFLLALSDVKKGKSLASALRGRKLFTPTLIQIVAVGEKTGNLDGALTDAAPYFDEQAERKFNLLVNILQPAALIFMGAAVGLLFYAVYLPMISIMGAL